MKWNGRNKKHFCWSKTIWIFTTQWSLAQFIHLFTFHLFLLYISWIDFEYNEFYFSLEQVLIIGAGPCGLRTAIECAFLGARTVVVEKRDRFSRNNVLHLWPYLITDLKNLGAKMFFGRFCVGAIDHISIRQLQCILLKVALLVGVEVHVNVAFDGLIEPPEDQSTSECFQCLYSCNLLFIITICVTVAPSNFYLSVCLSECPASIESL